MEVSIPLKASLPRVRLMNPTTSMGTEYPTTADYPWFFVGVAGNQALLVGSLGVPLPFPLASIQFEDRPAL